MSSTEEIHITIGGKSVPVTPSAVTPFSLNVSVGDTFSKNGEQRRVKTKIYFLTSDDQIQTIGLMTENP